MSSEVAVLHQVKKYMLILGDSLSFVMASQVLLNLTLKLSRLGCLIQLFDHEGIYSR